MASGKKWYRAVAVLSLAVLGFALPAKAAIVTFDSYDTADNTVPAPGDLGYHFYATNPDTASTLPSYVNENVGTSSTGTYGLTYLTISGNSKQTGLLYQLPSSGGVEINLLTLTLTAGTPSSFVLGILTDNGDQYGNGDAFRVTTSGSQTSDSGLIAGLSTLATGNGVNNFYLFNVTNVVANDVIRIYSLSRNTPLFGNTYNVASIGGITLDALPEPASLALLAVPAMLMARRRMA